MLEYAPAVLFAMFVWWFSTGAILYVDGLPRRTYRVSLGVTTALALLALWALWASAQSESVAAAYAAFGAALVVWGWHELSFLTGLVTGPRRTGCPDGASGWTRFRLATAVVIYHELALALTLGLVVLLTWGGPNQVGTWTFAVLWVMRLSAKLNIFLGVSNLSIEFIPDHLQYMRTYFRRASSNPLMPFSVVLSLAVVVWLAIAAASASPGTFVAVGTSLVATMLALALLEHVLLVVPVPDAILWRWALRAHTRRRALTVLD